MGDFSCFTHDLCVFLPSLFFSIARMTTRAEEIAVTATVVLTMIVMAKMRTIVKIVLTTFTTSYSKEDKWQQYHIIHDTDS